MNLLRQYFTFAVIGAASMALQAKPSVLSLADHVNDSTIIYPESVETDVHKMMQNWYLETYTALDKEADYRPDVETSDEVIIERLRTMPVAIEMPFNSVVRNYIDMYTGKKRSLVESMLGMSLYYMPIFEQALEREGIPNELKYLPVIESALNPDAVSRAGATGLWQIMLPTARGLGLEVNALVDERRDPVRSSEAATKYLRQLYEIYNDWSLAIAAYNCGPGNVNKALRRCEGDGKKDFWTIYPYLPAETRGYVPCFIAANYVMTYYNKHNISPALAKRPILTDSVHVCRRIHFKQIADVLHRPGCRSLRPARRCGACNRSRTAPGNCQRSGRGMGNGRTGEISQSAPQRDHGLDRKKIRCDTPQPQTCQRQHIETQTRSDPQGNNHRKSLQALRTEARGGRQSACQES